MALAVRSAQLGARKPLVRFLILTLVLGALFLGIKFTEYYAKIEEHLVPGSNFSYAGPLGRAAQIFFSFYFAMDWLQIDGKEIPLLEAPQKYDNHPRRILYVIFKHKKLIRNVFLLLIVPIVLYLLSRPTEYIATSKVLIKPSRAFLSVSPTARGGDDGSSMLESLH